MCINYTYKKIVFNKFLGDLLSFFMSALCRLPRSGRVPVRRREQNTISTFEARGKPFTAQYVPYCSLITVVDFWRISG